MNKLGDGYILDQRRGLCDRCMYDHSSFFENNCNDYCLKIIHNSYNASPEVLPDGCPYKLEHVMLYDQFNESCSERFIDEAL